VASDAKAFENDDETVLDESALLESEERSDSEPVTPPAAPVATSAPEPGGTAPSETGYEAPMWFPRPG
jgi:hypothetical protein